MRKKKREKGEGGGESGVGRGKRTKNRQVNPDPPFHAFFPKKRGLAEKSAVSLCFCPFLRFFGPKKAPFPCFGISTHAFFVRTALFLSLQMPFALKARVETTPKKHRKRKEHRKGDQGMRTCVCKDYPYEANIPFCFSPIAAKKQSAESRGPGPGAWHSHVQTSHQVFPKDPVMLKILRSYINSLRWSLGLSIMCTWTRPFWGNRLPERIQKPFLSPGSPSLQCQYQESSKVLAGLAFCEMVSQYSRSVFQGLCGGHQRGQQQFATQTLRVHLLGIEFGEGVKSTRV